MFLQPSRDRARYIFIIFCKYNKIYLHTNLFTEKNNYNLQTKCIYNKT